MRIYDESTSRRNIWTVLINWSRERTFSERQANFIRSRIPHVRGVYCIYAKYRSFGYSSPDWPTMRWSNVIYIGSGWLDNRLCAHLKLKRNSKLAEILSEHDLAFRYDRIVEAPDIDWPRTTEASLLQLFAGRFGQLPVANSRWEAISEMPLDKFVVRQPPYFNFLRRG